MNPNIDREIPLPQVAQNLIVCECEKPELKAFKDRNDEVVVECLGCLGFVKYPKGTK